MGSKCFRDECTMSIRDFSETSYSKSPEVHQLYSSLNLESPSGPKSIRWQRGNLIGEGCCGKVYQAMNLETGELIAIKTVKLNSDPAISEKELSKIQEVLDIFKSLDHPHIIKCFQADYCSTMNCVDLVFEYIPSGSMQDLLGLYKTFPIAVIRNYLKQLLEVLAYLHSNGIMHRDLKSANILVSEFGTIKLSDFGCSRRFDGELEFQSRSFIGSPYWMAPEIVRREWHSYSADIWSLGCLAIEMLTGVPPWSNVAAKTKYVFELISNDNAYPHFPRVCTSLTEFIQSCLDRNPKTRPTAIELLNSKFIIEPTSELIYQHLPSVEDAHSIRSTEEDN